jgi:hypothetical protein
MLADTNATTKHAQLAAAVTHDNILLVTSFGRPATGKHRGVLMLLAALFQLSL